MLLAVFSLCAEAIASGDTWWHLATGRWIVDNRSIPHQDFFSYSVAGKPWIAHEYLGEIGMYLLYRTGGFTALLLLNTALLTLAFWFVFRRCTGSRWVAAGAILLGVWAARPAFALRPQTVSVLLGAIFLLLIDDYLRYPRPRRLIWLPCLMLLWVQLHAGYALGIALIFASVAAAMLDALVNRGASNPKSWPALIAAGAACVAVVPLNPSGFRLLRFPFDVLSMKVNENIAEWRPPALDDPHFYPFLALAVLTLLVLLFAARKYRPGQFFLYALFLFLALKSARNIPLFVIIAVPLLAEHVRFPARRPWAKMSSAAATAAAFALLLISGAACVRYTSRAIVFQSAAEHTLFPGDGVSFLLAHRLSPNVLNDYSFSGYLIWRLYPEYRVYVDARADLYGDAFLAEYLDIYEARVSPDAFLDRWHVNTVILRPTSELSRILRMESAANRWRVAYEDDHAVIFARNTG